MNIRIASFVLCNCLFLSFSFFGFATATKDIFAKYPNAYFVETGTFLGDGIQNALDVGFTYIYSLELSPHYYAYGQARFQGKKNIFIMQGDSSKVLGQLIHNIPGPITFWLDGHCSNGNTAKGETMTPLIGELEAIKQHPIKTHTILIDDIRLCGTDQFDYIRLEDLIEKIHEINPNYSITYEDGHVKNDILVAHIH